MGFYLFGRAMSVYSNEGYSSSKMASADSEEMLSANVKSRVQFIEQRRGLGLGIIVLAMGVIGN